MRRAAHRDAAERDIVACLRAAGALVVHLDAKDVPDLLVGHRGVWRLFEVKAPAGPRGGRSADGQRLSEGQARFHELARARELPVVVVRSPEEALRAIGLVLETRGTA